MHANGDTAFHHPLFWQSSEACLAEFDKDQDGALNQTEFNSLLQALFVDRNGEAYSFSEDVTVQLFAIFDLDMDCKLNGYELGVCWTNWISKVLNPTSALIIVDVQNDFISGSLSLLNCPAKQDGAAVVPAINSLLDSVHFNTVVYTLDWHPADHISFFENVSKRQVDPVSTVSAQDAKMFDTVVFSGPPLTSQVLWPTHCVQESWGSRLHQDLNVVENAIMIRKGTNSASDSYSAFFDNNKLSQTDLDAQLRSRGITDVFVCGLAYDFCVGFTALHSLELGYRTIFVEDCVRGVDCKDIDTMKEQLVKEHSVFVKSNQVRDMVKGIDRNPVLAYKGALTFQQQQKIAKI